MRKKAIGNLMLLLIFQFSFLGCKKSGSTDISGTVKEYVTNIPIQNLKISLYKDHTVDISLSGGTPVGWYELIESTITDAQGNFHFNSKLENNYFLRINEEDIPAGYYTSGYYKIIAHETNNIVISPVTILKLHFKNVTPFDSNDKLSYSYFYSQYLIGMQIDTTLYKECFGNKNGTVDWKVTKNNVTTPHDTTLYFQGKDTLLLSIDY